MEKADEKLLIQMTRICSESIEDLQDIAPAPKACLHAIQGASRAQLRGVMIEVLRQYNIDEKKE